MDETFTHRPIAIHHARHRGRLMREMCTKVLKASPLKGSVRSKRNRCAPDPTFRTEITRPIFHGFGA
ncbi:MAG: hypothetical protein IAE77_04490 [Prosthecobacter sp.]|nr:hypothetical protein [Prosthecobacter sp.]